MKLDSRPIIDAISIFARQLGWVGVPDHVRPLLRPGKALDCHDILMVLADLKVKASTCKLKLHRIKKDQLPALIFSQNGKVGVLIEFSGKKNKIYDPERHLAFWVPAVRRTVDAIVPAQVLIMESTLLDRQENWFSNLSAFMGKYFRQAFWITLAISGLTLAIPFFVTLLFEQISANNKSISTALTIGMLGYVTVLLLLRTLRNQTLGSLGPRFGGVVSREVIRRILYLPPTLTEMAAVGAQIARLRDFDSIRDFFSGSTFVAVLEIPLLVILFAAIFFYGGVIGFVPLAAVAIFGISAIWIQTTAKKREALLGVASRERQDFLLETGSTITSIRNLRLETRWRERFAEMNERALKESVKAQERFALTSTLSSAVVSLTGLGTMGVGAIEIMRGAMTSGELVASMLLTWRILAPLRGVFSIASQFDRLLKSVSQIDKLMSLSIERPLHQSVEPNTIKSGGVIFSQVSLRYTSESQPALLGVSFELGALETLVIIGHGGSGKSSILKLILGMYQPQTGRITIDGLNVRQIDPTVLRRQIAYLPETPCIFSGTLADNLRLVDPDLDQERLEIAMGETGLEADFRSLGLNLNAPLDAAGIGRLGPSINKRINLAQVFLRQSNLWLLDNPSTGLDPLYERQLLATLAAVSGSVSMIIASEDTRYLSIAKKVLVLSGGRATFFGKTEAYLASIANKRRA